MKKKCEDCGVCCFETDMVVSEKDVELVLNNNSLGYLKKRDFTFRSKEGYTQLKNIENHCFFFDKKAKSCKIYEIRPRGCHFYPIIYDREKKNCVLDIDCPRNHLFYQDPKEFKTTCSNIKKFLKEQLNIEL